MHEQEPEAPQIVQQASRIQARHVIDRAEDLADDGGGDVEPRNVPGKPRYTSRGSQVQREVLSFY
jgi:hypothetical protein